MHGKVDGAVPFANSINQAADRYSVPAGILKNIMMAESSGNPNIPDSPAGAQGLMQFMPGTARDLRIDPYDPNQAIQGAARYLSQLYSKYGDWKLAVAAYNAGPGNVDKYGGVPPFAETQAYVQKVLGGG
ncbi:lytic transglycosylase domain-containing protein [Gordoniibacillus kamchatkensis]|uniref:lytic transglycosylase domain-containing protein n=1 Tax=Gordoniibacillus kamchatkensis TaxID=1590651 RepID=UPI0009E4960E